MYISVCISVYIQACKYICLPVYMYISTASTDLINSDTLLSFLLRCGTRPYERGTQ